MRIRPLREVVFRETGKAELPVLHGAPLSTGIVIGANRAAYLYYSDGSLRHRDGNPNQRLARKARAKAKRGR